MSPRHRLYQLTWPVLVAQLATIGMMAIDTVVVGYAGTDDLAALAVGASIYVSLALALSGVVQAVLPGVAHRLGRNDPEAAAHLVRQAFWLVLFLAILGDLVLFFPEWIIRFAELPESVASLTSDYLFVLALSLPASLGYRAFHAISGGMGKTRPLMWLSLAQTSGHAVLAPILVDSVSFGEITIGFGFGVMGAAYSQAFLAWLICLIGLLILRFGPVYRRLLGVGGPGRPNWREQRYLLKLGVPMGFSYLVEISAFTLMAIFIARLGPEVLAAHRIVANISAMVYMLPLAIGTATAALVGKADGGGDLPGALAVSRSAFQVASAGALIVGVLLWWARDAIVSVGSPDPLVRDVAAALLLYVAAYQIFDAIQTVAGFALRGYHVTLIPLAVHLAAFWVVGLGGGYWLAFEGLVGLSITPMGAAGFWCAALIATLVAAIGLVGHLLMVEAIKRREAAPLAS